MDTKKLIIIAVSAVIICIIAGTLIGMMNSTVNYERIEITENGTSIEIPTDNASYIGEINNTGAKLWTFKQGTLTTFNSAEASNARGLNGLGGALGIKEIKDMVINHFEKKETIDGFTVYTLDGQTMDIEGRDKIYVIETGNDTTHDNIIIATDNKDVTLHMAKSIQYKNPNIKNDTNNDTDSLNLNKTHTDSKKDSKSLSSSVKENSYDDDYSPDNSYDEEYDDYDSSDDTSGESSIGSGNDESAESNVETKTE